MTKHPSLPTLKKYGLTLMEWQSLYQHLKGKCPICERPFDDKVRPCVDHLHVKRYKKLRPEQKRKYVRGILCVYCNRRLVAKGMTTRRAYNVYEYLRKFDEKLEKL